MKSEIKNFISNKLSNKFVSTYENQPTKKYDIVIFLGSSHELSALELGKFMSNLEFCKTVVKKYGNKNYAVRAHPNQVQDPTWKTLALELSEYVKSIGGDFFAPDNKINSYSLIVNSSIVATYYSSISIDAYLLGAKVDVFGDTMPGYFIRYCDDKGGGNNERAEILASLCLISNYVCQQPLHPKWIILLKALGWIDRRFVNYLEL